MKRYELDIKSWEGVLIKRLVHPQNKKPYWKLEKTFDIIHQAYINKGNVGRDSLEKSLNEEYANITRGQITNYIDLCEICYLKRNKPKKGIVTNPILSKNFLSRMQVDLIDMQSQPDGDYRYSYNQHPCISYRDNFLMLLL